MTNHCISLVNPNYLSIGLTFKSDSRYAMIIQKHNSVLLPLWIKQRQHTFLHSAWEYLLCTELPLRPEDTHRIITTFAILNHTELTCSAAVSFGIG